MLLVKKDSQPVRKERPNRLATHHQNRFGKVGRPNDSREKPVSASSARTIADIN